MSLKTFNQQEKMPEEKKLETIVSEGSRVEDLVSYLKHSIDSKFPYYSIHFDADAKLLDNYLSYLKNVQITPQVVKNINKRLQKDLHSFSLSLEHKIKGIFLSALIQTSYNQGYNNFEFETLDADHFGSLLKGKEDNPIKIEAKLVDGHYCLSRIAYCDVKIGALNGNWAFYQAKDSLIYLKSLKGETTMEEAKRCTAKITDYKGHVFGWMMQECTIYAPKILTWLRLKMQASGNDKNNMIMLKNFGGKK